MAGPAVDVAIDTNQTAVWVALDIGHALMPAVFLAVSVAYVNAGFRWMNRQWFSAIAFTVGPYVCMLAFIEGMEWLRDIALNSV